MSEPALLTLLTIILDGHVFNYFLLHYKMLDSSDLVLGIFYVSHRSLKNKYLIFFYFSLTHTSYKSLAQLVANLVYELGLLLHP